MSDKVEDYMRLCVRSAGYAARASDPLARGFYKRLAERWFRRAVEAKGSSQPRTYQRRADPPEDLRVT